MEPLTVSSAIKAVFASSSGTDYSIVEARMSHYGYFRENNGKYHKNVEQFKPKFTSILNVFMLKKRLSKTFIIIVIVMITIIIIIRYHHHHLHHHHYQHNHHPKIVSVTQALINIHCHARIQAGIV